MNLRLIAFLLVATAAQASSLAAKTPASKFDPRTASLVAALQAVSPDPLGGKLGVEITRQAAAPVEKSNPPIAASMPAARNETPQPTAVPNVRPKS